MASISTIDTLLVSVFCMGRLMKRVTLHGIGSQAQLYSALRKHLGDTGGRILTIVTRNVTQGWSHTQPLLFAA